ncbi:MAG: SNF2-related protein [Phocaeicola sp.]
MDIEIKGSVFELQFKYRPIIVERIKQITGRRFDGDKKVWTVPTSSRIELERAANIIRQFEPINWITAETRKKQEETVVNYTLPELPELTTPLNLKITPYPYQLKGIARGLELKRFMNCDEPGLGKSNPLYSLISSPLGWVKMGDVAVGDKIFALDGSVQTVDAIYPQGMQATYRVTMSDGSYSDCNLEHLWCVRDQNRRRRGTGWIVKSLQELLEFGLLNKTNVKRELSGRKPSLKWEIPICEPVKYPMKELFIHPYVMGVLLGDGCTLNSPSLSLPSEKHGIINYMSPLIAENHTIRKATREGDIRFFIVSNDKHNNGYISYLREFGLNIKSEDKYIPNCYLMGSVEQRKELLAGLLDTDGICIKNKTTFHTTSTKLAEGVKELVQSLGGVVIIRKYDRTHENKGVEYQVNIRTDFNPFLAVDYKKNAWSINKSFLTTRYIKSVEYIGEHEQQCIRVSSSDHLYLTNDFIVTHNTLQSIATINAAGAFPCLVICPSSLKINWEREWHKFTDKKALVLNDKVRDTWPFFYNTGMYDVFIVNYESLKKYFVQRIKKAERWRLNDVEFRESIKLFKSVIMDESHRCKSAATQQAKFCKGITAGKEWIIELTGTPVVNKPKDLIPQLAILDRLGDFGGYKNFVNRYCSGKNEASNLKELNYMLWTNAMFRREKSLVLQDLPDKVRQVNSCEITNRKEYQDAERDLIMYLQKYKDADDEKIQSALRGEVMVKIGILRNISARGKVRDVVEFVKDFRENGQKIILFCSLHEVVDQLKEYFPHAVSVTGRDTQDEKQRAVDAFQNDPKTDIIICSIKAAGVGLTLTASSNVAFVEFPWTYADCCQCEDRAHRIGQKDSVTCYYFLGRRTIDERVYKIIQEKKSTANAVMGATDDIQESVVDMVANLFSDEFKEE